MTVPFGLFCGLFLAESEGMAAGAIRFVADVMTGMPSITIGIFGYIAIVKTTGSYSGVAGSFAIGFIMLPIIIRAGETAIRGVPRHLGEAALALGRPPRDHRQTGGGAGSLAGDHHRDVARDRTGAR